MPKRRKRKNGNSKALISIFLSFSFLVLAIVAFNIFSPQNIKVASRNSLQLGTFQPSPTTTPTEVPNTTLPPLPSVCGNHDNGQKISEPISCDCPGFSYMIKCENKKCVDVDLEHSFSPITCEEVNRLVPWRPIDPGNWCGNTKLAAGGDGWYCIGKPVIYLYPTKPTIVDVKVQSAGNVVISDPLYPDGGWKNVLAEPGGRLTYQGKIYRELFYESEVNNVKRPITGITLNSGNIKSELDSLISKLGLVGEEKTEFLDFWTPKLQAFNSKYVFFSILEESEKKRIDSVSYNPQPETVIEFIAYFAQLEKPYDGPRLQLPPTPQRVGFTVVEWGGVIGK